MCGPGHGIRFVRVFSMYISEDYICIALHNIIITLILRCFYSIGSLGSSNAYETVEEIFVKNCTFKSAIHGVRIKTWEVNRKYLGNHYFDLLLFFSFFMHKACATKISFREFTYESLI